MKYEIIKGCPDCIAIDATPSKECREFHEGGKVVFGCSSPIRFITSDGEKTMEPGKEYDKNLNEIK